VVTSPPYYGLRDYGIEGQLGLEESFYEYIEKMLLVTAELKRVLKETGTVWWNHGDSYASKPAGNSTAWEQKQSGDGLYTRLWERNTNRRTTRAPFAGQFGKEKNPGKQRLDSEGKRVTGRCRGLEFPEKSLLLQAHRLAVRMIDEQGWILRNQIIWWKPNAMPSSVRDRFTVDFEKLFFFVKSRKYWFETQRERAKTPGSVHVARRGDKGSVVKDTVNRTYFDRTYITGEMRTKRCVWQIPSRPFRDAHFAVFPEILVETPIKAGCPPGGIVLDPFMGSGTTAVVAERLGRNYLGIELNPEYAGMAERRIARERLRPIEAVLGEAGYRIVATNHHSHTGGK
jgi:DNA modification methylase